MTPDLLRQKGSLQRRLSLSLTAAIAALWLVATVAAGLVLRQEIDAVFDSALQEVAQRVLPLAYLEILDRDGAFPADGRAAAVPSVAPHRETITYIVRDATGRLLMQSHDAEPAAFPAHLERGFHEAAGKHFFTESAVRGTLFITTTERAGHRQRAVFQAAVTLVWPLVVLLPLSLAGVWWLVARTFKPVARFQKAIEARDHHNLTPLATARLPTEIMPIAEAVNALVARLRRAIDSEHRFAANSAHELRTPVAAALAQTQRLMAELPEGAPRERGRAIEAALQRLSRLSEKLLQWAKAEGGSLIADHPQDVAEILMHVLDDVGAGKAKASRLLLTLPASGQCFSTLDIDAFAILARNLIENALKHGAADQPVRIQLTETGLFSVCNGGPVIAPEDLARLMAPFERGETRAEGVGLGLSIVQSIAQGAGGSLVLVSPAPGRQDGLQARVQLPS